MKRCKFRYWLLWGCMLLLVACGKSDWDENGWEDERNASLTLAFRSVENTLSTRGVEDLDDDGIVSETELYVDGRRMYRLGVFLVDSEEAVAAWTVLEENDPRFASENTEAEVNFDNLEYNETYTLYAIANYGDYEELTGYISDTDITEYTVTNTHQVQASSDNVCNHAIAYPLSLKKEITLEAGKNTIIGNLVRTYARLRIGVCNQSTEKKLTVTGLSFPDNFVQSQADLFAEGGTADVTPIVTSVHAITPFQPNVVVPKKDVSGNVTETTVFDTYLLESNGGTYNYTLNLKMEDDKEYTITDGVQLNDRNNVNNNNKGPYYVIYNVMSGTYLYANPNTNKVELGTSYGSNGAVDPNYVWKLERPKSQADNFSFFVESMGMSGHYIQGTQASSNKLTLTDSPASSDYLQLDTQTDRLVLYKGNYYLAVDNNRLYWHTGRINGNRTIQQFCFYEVSMSGQSTDSSVTHTETIPIRINDEDITAIKRNDFIDIVVNVSYDEGSRQASPRIVVEH